MFIFGIDGISFPENVTIYIERGAILSVGNGVTLTFNTAGTPSSADQIQAGRFQIFSFTGTGACAGLQYAHAEWFGADPTVTSASRTACVNALSSLNANGTLYMMGLNYLIDGTLTEEYVLTN